MRYPNDRDVKQAVKIHNAIERIKRSVAALDKLYSELVASEKMLLARLKDVLEETR